MSFDYESQAVIKMVELVADNSWKIDEVDREESLEALHELIPEPVFNAIFDKYAEISKFRNQSETTKVSNDTTIPSEPKPTKTTPLYRYNIQLYIQDNIIKIIWKNLKKKFSLRQIIVIVNVIIIIIVL